MQHKRQNTTTHVLCGAWAMGNSNEIRTLNPWWLNEALSHHHHSWLLASGRHFCSAGSKVLKVPLMSAGTLAQGAVGNRCEEMVRVGGWDHRCVAARHISSSRNLTDAMGVDIGAPICVRIAGPSMPVLIVG